MILHSSEHELFLTAPGERKLSLRSMVNDEAVRNFFSGIVTDALARNSKIDTVYVMLYDLRSFMLYPKCSPSWSFGFQKFARGSCLYV